VNNPNSFSLTAHPDYDPVLPAGPAADYVGKHVKTLYKVTMAGQIACIRSKGGRLSYRLSALNAYLDSLTEKPRSAKPTQEIDWGA
jgi:hypothetical protein